MRIRGVILYPFFAAIYPVVALATNPGEIQGLWVLTWPIAISLFVATCAWLLCSVFIRDPDRRAFVTFMIVILFASYGYFILILGQVAWAAPYAHTILPLLFLAAYLAGTTYVVLRFVPNTRKLTGFLTILTSILVLWNTAVLLVERTRWNTLVGSWSGGGAGDDPSVSVTGKAGPDIYLIVLDKYTGSRSLKANFGFDNSDFEMFLREHGFVLPGRPQANYIYTTLSLASLLNFRYLDSLPADPGAQRRNKAYVSRLVEDNAVWRFLQKRGYRFIFFPTGFPFTGNNRLADLQVPDPHKILSEFEIVWRRTTLAEPLITWVCQRTNCPHGPAPFADEARFLEWRFDRLREVARWPRDGRPLFVFAHLTVPHEPYIFNSDCSVRPPFWPSYFEVEDERPEKQAYIAQIVCLNRRLKSIVEHLIKDSPSPPIILLQSDHGHGRMPLHIPDVRAVTPDRIAERADIFAAYYLPGADARIVSDSISPVNVFRMVFREYFKADLPPLPDRTYWSPGTELFQFTRVQAGQPREN
jgi:hypothetical protein